MPGVFEQGTLLLRGINHSYIELRCVSTCGAVSNKSAMINITILSNSSHVMSQSSPWRPSLNRAIPLLAFYCIVCKIKQVV